MRIQHNITAMNSYRNFSANTSSLSKNLEKLSSGYKINRAGDDAAGLAISEKMRAQITGLEGATKNAKDGISLIQTAEGALTEVHDMLNRMVTLTEQSANGTYADDVDREQLQKEVEALKSEINRIADSTNFNGLKLLNGDLDTAKATTVTMDSAISNITSTDFVAKGKTDVFSIDEDSIKIRPKANTTQTNASFKVNLNAASFTGAASGDTLTLSVNGTEISFTATSATYADTQANNAAYFGVDGATDASKLAKMFAASGKQKAALTEASGASGSTTSEWSTGIGAANQSAANYTAAQTYSYAQIDNHWWKMEASGSTITFTQVDKMDTGTPELNPSYSVALSGKHSDDTEVKVSQQPNDQVQVTSTGTSIGSSQQATVDIKIDLANLKDGDRLIAGDKTYVFAVGKDSNFTAANYPAASMADGEVRVDLSKIFAEDEDFTDAAKQAEAMAKIVKDMGTAGTGDTNTATAGASNVWTIGNGGVSGGIGTLSFQSLDTYDESNLDGSVAGKTQAQMIGTGKDYTSGTDDDTQIASMGKKTDIIKQFEGNKIEAAATTSFDLDVTKIKVGDTFNIDGKTFEFTDGVSASTEGAIAVDLSSLGVSNGLLASQRADVFDKVEDVLSENLQATNTLGAKIDKYTFSSSGNKITLTSNDDSTTNNTFENRISANMTIPTETTYGKGLVLQIGDTSDEYNQLSISVSDMHSDALGIGDVNISTQDGAAVALDKIKDAVNQVSDVRGTMGALQNRLDHTINNLGVMRENIQNAESNIRDTDVAEEMMTYTKNSILNQSAQAMLAQANQLPQGVLQLLG